MAMVPGPESQRLTPAERDNLVAYLDGELPDGESRRIATKLTSSPTARREVEVLERTWQLLDHLPRPKAPEDFTERTLTGVRLLEERGGALESVVATVVRRIAWAAIWLVAATLALGAGYVLTNRGLPHPTDRLARDLSIAEHLDEYRDVGSLEFLHELAISPQFNNDPGN
jgi:anti-sigma factor RsiW